MEIGAKIYYDLSTGNVIFNTGQRTGSVIETTIEQDFEAYVSLAERVPSTVGCIQLEFGELAQDFMECNGYHVNLTTGLLEFSYPDPSDPAEPPVYRPPLSVEVTQLKADNASLTDQLAGTNADMSSFMDFILTELNLA
jgi:hypothetical protein